MTWPWRHVLELLRRRSVYRPGVYAHEIQEHIQLFMRQMAREGWPAKDIAREMRAAAHTALIEAAAERCNEERAALFSELVELELQPADAIKDLP